MRPERLSDTPECEALHLAIRADAAAQEGDGDFPAAAFETLRARGLLEGAALFEPGITPLLRLLSAVGRGDLSVGRIFEGHVNALALLRRHGTRAQRAPFESAAGDGGLLGVWNTDDPGRPLQLADGVLSGAKSFASGVDGLSRAIVTVSEPAGRVMLLVPLEGRPVDRSWWRPMGMRASGSHIVDFTGLAVTRDMILGAPDAYLEAPWFAAGAIRFVAVHVGGAHAVLDAALDHLRGTGRAADPHQLHRIARMGTAVESGYALLDRVAAEWEATARGQASADGLVASVNAARGAVEAMAMAVLEEAERGVGAAGMIEPHPLERLIRDLRTYLRQPNPDGAASALGQAIAEGRWEPGRTFPKER